MKRLIVALTALALAACGNNAKDANGDGIGDGTVNPTSVTTVAPSTPVGSVSGTVLTTQFKPLADVTVTLVLGGRTNATDGKASSFAGTTDAAGNFSFQNVPAGSQAEVTFQKMGFGEVRTAVAVPAGTGNVPVNNANGNVGVVLLNALTATVKFNVFTRAGQPAKSVRGLLEVSPAGFTGAGTGAVTYGNPSGIVSVDATVDDTGTITFVGVPDPAELSRVSASSNYTLVLSSFDQNNDGRVDFNGSITSYAGRDLFTMGQQTILLSDARVASPLSILATNIESLRTPGVSSPLRNLLKPNDKIYVLFNQPVLGGTSLTAKIVQEDCSTSAAMTYELSTQGTLLTITPGTGWTVGTKYAVAIRATPTDTTGIANTTAFYGYFFGGDAATPKPVAAATFTGKKAPGSTGSSTALQNGDTLYVNFDAPVRSIGGPSARVFFNYDLDGSGTTGGMGDIGEVGGPFNTGLAISQSEVASTTANTFACVASGYSSRYVVALTALPTSGVPAGTQMKILFSKDTSTTEGYQTIWGVPVLPTNGELAGTLAVSN